MVKNYTLSVYINSMKSFIKFIEENPSNSDLIKYQIKEIEHMIKNASTSRDQFKNDSDFDDWMHTRFEAQIDILISILRSLKYILRKLQE